MTKFKFISSPSGDWSRVEVNDRLYYEGHNIPEHIFIELLELFVPNCIVEEVEEDME